MTNTRQQLIELFVTLNELTDKGNTTFKYAVTKNLNTLEKSIEPLLYIEAGIENLLKDYKEDYKKIIKKYGRINPETNKSEIDIDSASGKLAKQAIDLLNENYKEVLDNYSENEKKYRELLDSETIFDFKLHTSNLLDIPMDITKKQMNSLINFNLITE